MIEPTAAEIHRTYMLSGERVMPCAACGGSGVMGSGLCAMRCVHCDHKGWVLKHRHWLEYDEEQKAIRKAERTEEA